MSNIPSSALILFDRWFSSQAGVYQTLAFTLVVILIEYTFPHLDPQGIGLLYWLTVYSAVTQPALAHTGRAAADRLEAIETALDLHVQSQGAHIADILALLSTSQERT